MKIGAIQGVIIFTTKESNLLVFIELRGCVSRLMNSYYLFLALYNQSAGLVHIYHKLFFRLDLVQNKTREFKFELRCISVLVRLYLNLTKPTKVTPLKACNLTEKICSDSKRYIIQYCSHLHALVKRKH